MLKIMPQFRIQILWICLIFACACKTEKQMQKNPDLKPPLADIKPYQLKMHDDIRVDNYFWLNDRENPDVIDYLERENDYYKKSTVAQESLRKDLFEEMKSRIKEDDSSVPYFYNGYWYITRFETGKDYPIYTRKKEVLEAEEEILFDCNLMAQAHEYFRLVGINVSPDNTKVAFGVDTVSRRQYTLKVKDLLTGEILDTSIPNTTGGSVWAKDNRHLFYTQKDPVTLRSSAIFRHDIHHSSADDTMIFEEKDDTFSTYVFGSKSEDYIFIGSFSTLTTEYQFLSTATPLEEFQYIQKRIRGLEYSVSHFGPHFYIMTNGDEAENFKIMRTPVLSPSKDNWEDFLPHREDVLLEDIELFKEYWVVTERSKGLSRIRIQDWEGKQDYYLPMDGETYTAYTSTNISFDTTQLRYVYNAMTTPTSVMEYDMKTGEKRVLKEQQVLGGEFKKENYTSERLWATADDGEKIPISLVRHVDTPLTAETPLLLYAYGSYGSTIDPDFSTTRLSLLDRGFIFAIAHVRGGEYMGRSWYESGKLLHKKNTFTDFIACSKHLISLGYTSAAHHYAYGGSAGGLLMGVVLNEAPSLYNGVIAAVPFVDVVSTMLDDSIPLTTGEYDEWGNPNEEKYYHYIKSYSPYDNVKQQAYPNILVTTGLHDSQVQYWEPAKWVAKLRVNKTDKNKLFLDTNMTAGHGGASGRFDALKETAKKYAFLFALENKD